MSLDRAQKALDKAESDHQKWQVKLQEAKARHAAMAEEHGAVDVSPDSAEKVFAEQDSQEQKIIGVIEKLAAQVKKSAGKVAERQRDLVEAHYHEEHGQIEHRRAALLQHRERRDGLLRELRDLDGVKYVPEPLRSSVNPRETGHLSQQPTTRERELHEAFISAQVRAVAIRYFLDTGTLATIATVRGDEVRVANGTPVSFRARWIKPEEKPSIIYGEHSGTGAKRPIKERMRGVGRIGVPDGRPMSKVPASQYPGGEGRW